MARQRVATSIFDSRVRRTRLAGTRAAARSKLTFPLPVDQRVAHSQAAGAGSSVPHPQSAFSAVKSPSPVDVVNRLSGAALDQRDVLVDTGERKGPPRTSRADFLYATARSGHTTRLEEMVTRRRSANRPSPRRQIPPKAGPDR